MSQQRSFSELEYNQKKRVTRREKFLQEMEVTVPWSGLIAILTPFYHKTGGRGRQPKALSSYSLYAKLV